MKPGIRTTELLVTVLTDIGLVCSSVAGVLPPKWAAIIAGVAQSSYAISRGLAKQAAAALSAPSVVQPGSPPAVGSGGRA